MRNSTQPYCYIIATVYITLATTAPAAAAATTTTTTTTLSATTNDKCLLCLRSIPKRVSGEMRATFHGFISSEINECNVGLHAFSHFTSEKGNTNLDAE
jgi:hypothetical protein